MKLDDTFTYGQCKEWPEGERRELIDGEAWAMSSPTNRHQMIFARLARDFIDFLEGKPCIMFPAPFDVLLPKGNEENDRVSTVLQPDLVVYCDRSKLLEAGARGAPDPVVEILSPTTAKRDLNEKFNLYEGHGVREYWVIDPAARTICVYRRGGKGLFDHGEFREPFKDRTKIESRVLEGFAMDPEGLFADLP